MMGTCSRLILSILNLLRSAPLRITWGHIDNAVRFLSNVVVAAPEFANVIEGLRAKNKEYQEELQRLTPVDHEVQAKKAKAKLVRVEEEFRIAAQQLNLHQLKLQDLQ